MVGSTARIAAPNRRNRSTFPAGVVQPIWCRPKISLPISQYRTPYGSGCPFSARSRPIGVSAGPLQYSTHAAASSAVPSPALTQISGSQPTCWQ